MLFPIRFMKKRKKAALWQPSSFSPDKELTPDRRFLTTFSWSRVSSLNSCYLTSFNLSFADSVVWFFFLLPPSLLFPSSIPSHSPGLSWTEDPAGPSGSFDLCFLGVSLFPWILGSPDTLQSFTALVSSFLAPYYSRQSLRIQAAFYTVSMIFSCSNRRFFDSGPDFTVPPLTRVIFLLYNVFVGLVLTSPFLFPGPMLPRLQVLPDLKMGIKKAALRQPASSLFPRTKN